MRASPTTCTQTSTAASAGRRPSRQQRRYRRDNAARLIAPERVVPRHARDDLEGPFVLFGRSAWCSVSARSNTAFSRARASTPLGAVRGRPRRHVEQRREDVLDEAALKDARNVRCCEEENAVALVEAAERVGDRRAGARKLARRNRRRPGRSARSSASRPGAHRAALPRARQLLPSSATTVQRPELRLEDRRLSSS